MLKPQFRLDIQALRAVAVLAVVGFHLWPETITGGFVGVDVFFVISGYLITAHLIRDAQKTDRISFAKFYTRRAIRLLPSALAVLLTTAIGIILFVPRMNWESWLPQLFSSAFYVENWHLLFNSVDYLLAAEAPSPTQHYWTLSVEEQFYIFLPMVLFIALLLTRKTKLSLNRSIFLFLIPLFAASFVLNLILTVESPSVAYFNTFSRAWEFGIGALLANLFWRPQKFKVALEILGFAMILLSVFVIRPDQAFPGWLAVLPVAGAALIILAENQRSGPVHKALAPWETSHTRYTCGTGR